MRWLLICVFTGPALLLAQTVFVASDSQRIELGINQLQQEVQRVCPGRVRLEFDSTLITVDGQTMSGTQFVQSFASIVAAMPYRNLAMVNPLPGKLGTFWDFEVVEPALEFSGDTCVVTCSYRLLASGVRTVTGHIEFVKSDWVWRVTRLDGLLPFLIEELELLRGAQKVLPKEQKR